jgi:hypothetical protein
MSKFDFLEEMFFGRTEKSGRKYRIYCRTENAKENNIFNKILEKHFGKFGTFWDKYLDILNNFTQFTLSKRVILFFKNIKEFIPYKI